MQVTSRPGKCRNNETELLHSIEGDKPKGQKIDLEDGKRVETIYQVRKVLQRRLA